MLIGLNDSLPKSFIKNVHRRIWNLSLSLFLCTHVHTRSGFGNTESWIIFHIEAARVYRHTHKHIQTFMETDWSCISHTERSWGEGEDAYEMIWPFREFNTKTADLNIFSEAWSDSGECEVNENQLCIVFCGCCF